MAFESSFGSSFQPDTSGMPMPEWGDRKPTPQERSAYEKRFLDWSRGKDPAKTEAQRRAELERQLGKLTGYQEEAFGRLTRGFRTAAETGVAQQLGGVLRGVGQTAARRGIIGSGVMAGAEAQVRGQLAGRALSAQLEFRQQLAGMHEKARQGFILGKFDYFEAMDMQINQQEFEEHMARLNRSWELDDQKRQQFWDFAQGLGGFGVDVATGQGWI